MNTFMMNFLIRIVGLRKQDVLKNTNIKKALGVET